MGHTKINGKYYVLRSTYEKLKKWRNGRIGILLLDNDNANKELSVQIAKNKALTQRYNDCMNEKDVIFRDSQSIYNDLMSKNHELIDDNNLKYNEIEKLKDAIDDFFKKLRKANKDILLSNDTVEEIKQSLHKAEQIAKSKLHFTRTDAFFLLLGMLLLGILIGIKL